MSSNDNGSVVAFNASDGDKLWSHQLQGYMDITGNGLQVVHGIIYVPTMAFTFQVHALRIADGSQVHIYELDDHSIPPFLTFVVAP